MFELMKDVIRSQIDDKAEVPSLNFTSCDLKMIESLQQTEWYRENMYHDLMEEWCSMEENQGMEFYYYKVEPCFSEDIEGEVGKIGCDNCGCTQFVIREQNPVEIYQGIDYVVECLCCGNIQHIHEDCFSPSRN